MQHRNHDQRQDGDAQRQENGPIAGTATHTYSSVRDEHRDRDRQCNRNRDVSTRPGREREAALLEHHRPVLEQELEQSFQRHSEEDALCRLSMAGGVPTDRSFLHLRDCAQRRWQTRATPLTLTLFSG